MTIFRADETNLGNSGVYQYVPRGTARGRSSTNTRQVLPHPTPDSSPPLPDEPPLRPRFASVDQAADSGYTVLFVPTNRIPGRKTRQQRRMLFHEPIQEIMQIIDSVQDQIPEGDYLKMANSAKKLYDLVEDMVPVRASEREPIEVNSNDAFSVPARRIAQLQCKNIELEEELKRIEHMMHRSQLIRDGLLMKVRVIERDLKSTRAIIDEIKVHPVVGPHLAYMQVMREIQIDFFDAGI